jgi:hypothetical protein
MRILVHEIGDEHVLVLLEDDSSVASMDDSYSHVMLSSQTFCVTSKIGTVQNKPLNTSAYYY